MNKGTALKKSWEGLGMTYQIELKKCQESEERKNIIISITSFQTLVQIYHSLVQTDLRQNRYLFFV